jgi:cytochrome c-type biogenesis protein CcmH
MNAWLLGALLLGASLLWVFLPRGRSVDAEHSAVTGVDDAARRAQENVRLHRERLAELEQELAAGGLAQDEYQRRRSEAELALYEDAFGAGTELAPKPASLTSERPSLVLLGGVAVVLGASALTLYLHLGAADKARDHVASGITPASLAQQQRERSTSAQTGAIQDMAMLIAELHRKLKEQPDNLEGWLLLGRSAMNINQFALAEEAYLQVIEQMQAHGGALAPFYGLLAQVRYLAAGDRVLPGVQEAIDLARQHNPDELNVLALLAMDAFSRQDYQAALDHWQRMLAVAPDHPSREQIEQGISQARARLGLVETDVRQPDTGPGIKLEIALAPELEGRFPPSTPVFVFARAPSGPPVPIAASRHTVAELPLMVRLHDGNSMAATTRLSEYPQVRVTARVSRSGRPIAGAGDWEVTMESVPVGGSEVFSLIIGKEILSD